MKLMTTLLILVATAALAACGKQTSEQKITRQIEDNVHALTPDERTLAQTNAKAYYEKEFPVERNGKLDRERGAFLECRPSDSNFNGLVTCKGMVPQPAGGFKEVTRYCGYMPKLVGCSDEDTVKN